MELTEDSVEFHGGETGVTTVDGRQGMSTATVNPVGTSTQRALPPGHYGLSGLLRSEWTKLRTVRSTMWTLGITVVVGIGISALATAETRAHWATMSPGNRLSFDPTSTSLTALLVLPAGHRRAGRARHECGVRHRNHPRHLFGCAPAAAGARGQGGGVRCRGARRGRDRGLRVVLRRSGAPLGPGHPCQSQYSGRPSGGRRHRALPRRDRAVRARAGDHHPPYGRGDQRLRRHPPGAPDHRPGVAQLPPSSISDGSFHCASER